MHHAGLVTRQHDADYAATMLLTAESAPNGTVRIYATQLASVVSYFEDDGDGACMLVVEPGEFACRWSTTQEKLDAVKAAVLSEVAARLNCDLDKVQCRSMSELYLVADPVLKETHRWTGRRHSRTPAR